MTCAGCEKTLERREHAQPMTVLGVRCWPRSFCDDCCRKHPFTAGSDEALRRLAAGGVDPVEQARVVEATRGWAPPYEAVLAAVTPDLEGGTS